MNTNSSQEKDLQNLIAQKEDLLKAAMIKSDIEILDDLLSDDLKFTIPTGQTAGKQDDLNVHRSGIQKITEINLINRHIDVVNFSIINVRAEVELKGTYQNADISGKYLFKRKWVLQNNKYQITEGSSSLL